MKLDQVPDSILSPFFHTLSLQVVENWLVCFLQVKNTVFIHILAPFRKCSETFFGTWKGGWKSDANLCFCGWDFIKSSAWGTSLVIQWLRIHHAMQGMWVQSLVGELGSHRPPTRRAMCHHGDPAKHVAPSLYLVSLCQFGHIRGLGLSPALWSGLVDPVGYYFRLRGQHGVWSHLSPQTAAGLLVFLATKGEVRVWMDEHSLLLTPHRWDSTWFHSIHGNGVPSSAPPVHPIPFQLSPSASIPSICFATFISLIRYKTLFHQLSPPAPMGGQNIH